MTEGYSEDRLKAVTILTNAGDPVSGGNGGDNDFRSVVLSRWLMVWQADSNSYLLLIDPNAPIPLSISPYYSNSWLFQ